MYVPYLDKRKSADIDVPYQSTGNKRVQTQYC